MRAKRNRESLKRRLAPSWWAAGALAGAAAAAAIVLKFIPSETPVQQTVLGLLQHAMWITAAACAAFAAGSYALGRYRARKANPYARLKLEREPRFNMPHLGPHAVALAVGEPLIRIRDVRRPAPPDRWSAELLRVLEWKRFDLLCAAYYGHRRFRVAPCGASDDGGSEAELYFKELPRPVALLACKAWSSRPVGVKPLRQLLDVMKEKRVAKGIVHCAGDYTNEAKAYARENRIRLVTGAELLESIAGLPEAVQKALLELTTSGDYTTPTCPSCGEKMVMCSSELGDFWGCSGYPGCKATLVVMQASW